MSDAVDHPSHYGGEDNPYEVIKVLEAWSPEMAKHFCLGNTIKYLGRAGKKTEDELEDLEKAAWYAAKAVEITQRQRDEVNLVEKFTGAIVRDNYPYYQSDNGDWHYREEDH